jgi:hypothetical protein
MASDEEILQLLYDETLVGNAPVVSNALTRAGAGNGARANAL